jgi:hypothetical protein
MASGWELRSIRVRVIFNGQESKQFYPPCRFPLGIFLCRAEKPGSVRRTQLPAGYNSGNRPGPEIRFVADP